MKLLHIWNSVSSPSSKSTGCDSHNRFLREAFRNLGHEVVLFDPGIGKGYTAEGMKKHRYLYRWLKGILPPIAAEWLRDSYSLLYDFKAVDAISKTIEEEQPDFVYERFSNYHFSGFQAAKFHGKPYVLEIHDPPEARAIFSLRVNFEAYNRHIQEKLLKEANIIVVVSSYLEHFVLDAGVPPDKVLMLPNGVNLDLFRPTGERASIRARLGLTGKLVVGFVGSMQSYHGLDLLPDLCDHLRTRRDDICFLLVGGFDEYPGGEAAYREKLSRRDMIRNFVLVGAQPVERVPAHVEAMDICIMPDSNHFGSPVKLFEYGAMAKPSIFPRYGPVEDVMMHEVNGLIFEPKSVNDMAAQVLRLADDEELGRRLGDRLYQDVLTNHTWERNAARIVTRIEQLLAIRDQST